MSMLRPRIVFALLLAFGLPARAQDAADADPFVFTDEAALILWQVRADKADDFTLVWRIIRERAEAQGDDRVKNVLNTLRLFRATTPPAPDIVMFVSRIEPAAPGLSYSPTSLLFESGMFERPEADELFALLMEALAETTPVSTIPLGSALPSADTLP